MYVRTYVCMYVVVVVVFTLTDRASTIPSNIRGCQSGTWSQRGTKVNGSHHGDNPLLRPTGIQIATKSYATLQAMTPTNSRTVHQTSFTPYREQPRLYGHTYSKSKDQPGKVDNPARGQLTVLYCMYVCMVTHIARVWINRVKVANPAHCQLNRKNEYFPVRVRA